jgi:hypothetical protein
MDRIEKLAQLIHVERAQFAAIQPLSIPVIKMITNDVISTAEVESLPHLLDSKGVHIIGHCVVQDAKAELNTLVSSLGDVYGIPPWFFVDEPNQAPELGRVGDESVSIDLERIKRNASKDTP